MCGKTRYTRDTKIIQIRALKVLGLYFARCQFLYEPFLRIQIHFCCRFMYSRKYSELTEVSVTAPMSFLCYLFQQIQVKKKNSAGRTTTGQH
jgi:hypothetical protein